MIRILVLFFIVEHLEGSIIGAFSTKHQSIGEEGQIASISSSAVETRLVFLSSSRAAEIAWAVELRSRLWFGS